MTHAYISEVSAPEHQDPPRGRPARFTTTHWSVVLGAGSDSESRSAEALEQLCRTYWYPLFAYARGRGLDVHAAQDVIQGFFEQLLRRGAIRGRTPDQGRFRSFLLGSLNYYMADCHDRSTAAKRGGSTPPIALDAMEAEERYRHEPVERLTPERVFERRWALTLLENVLGRLQKECEEAGRAEQFRLLRPHLFDGGEQIPYNELAESLGVSTGTLRVTVHRFRYRCRELFHEEVAQTLQDPHEVEDELLYLRRVLAS
jgi:RNA polymerase sigma factor (sigma-70 family)